MVPIRKLLLAIPLVILVLTSAGQGAVARPNPASAAPVYSLPRFENPILSNSWVIADFDGDGRPDLLTATPAGEAGPGQSAGPEQAIEVRFGTPGHEPSAFRIPDSRLGLNLIAWDVDGDHDLDLIVVNAISNRLLGVWINDGAGRFTEAQSPSVPDSLQSLSDGRVASPASRSCGALIVVEEERAAGALPAPCIALRPPAAHGAPLSRAFSAPHCGSVSLHPGRAPPASVLPL